MVLLFTCGLLIRSGVLGDDFPVRGLVLQVQRVTGMSTFVFATNLAPSDNV